MSKHKEEKTNVCLLYTSRRGREADTERLVALSGQIFETEQEIPRALTPLPPENRPQWWCVEEDGTLLGGVALYRCV